MPVRKAEALWEGNPRKGKGRIKLGSGAYEGAYSFSSRFEEGFGTNPEEFLGAAYAGCYSMELSVKLEQAGYSPEYIHTTARVHLDSQGSEVKIITLELQTEAKVPGMDAETFQEEAEAAKKACPVCRALCGMEIILQALLLG